MNKEKQMRIFTTLLVLLLSSPSVFAETWVCSFENEFGIATHTHHSLLHLSVESECRPDVVRMLTEKMLPDDIAMPFNMPSTIGRNGTLMTRGEVRGNPVEKYSTMRTSALIGK